MQRPRPIMSSGDLAIPAASASRLICCHAHFLRSITFADCPGRAVCWQNTCHCGPRYKETHMIKTLSLATWMLQLRHDDQSPQTEGLSSIGESARCLSSLCATRSGASKRSRGADRRHGTSALPAWTSGGFSGLLGPSVRADAAESRWDKLCSGEITVRRDLCCGRCVLLRAPRRLDVWDFMIWRFSSAGGDGVVELSRVSMIVNSSFPFATNFGSHSYMCRCKADMLR
jgi:hypothetical protein